MLAFLFSEVADVLSRLWQISEEHTGQSSGVRRRGEESPWTTSLFKHLSESGKSMDQVQVHLLLDTLFRATNRDSASV